MTRTLLVRLLAVLALDAVLTGLIRLGLALSHVPAARADAIAPVTAALPAGGGLAALRRRGPWWRPRGGLATGRIAAATGSRSSNSTSLTYLSMLDAEPGALGSSWPGIRPPPAGAGGHADACGRPARHGPRGPVVPASRGPHRWTGAAGKG